MALELPGAAISPADVSRFSDMVLSGIGQARPRFRSYCVDLFSCQLFRRTDRDEFSLSIRGGGVPHPTYTRVEDRKFCVVIGYLVLANCIHVVLILASSTGRCVSCSG